MKKMFTLGRAMTLAGLFAVCATAQANVVFTETFNERATGTLNVGDAGYIDYDGNWYNQLGTNFFQVVDEQLTKADYATETEGKAVQFTQNHGSDFILFDPQTTGSVFMGFLLNVRELNTKTTANNILAFVSSTSSFAAGYLFGQVRVQTIDESSYRLLLAKRGETASSDFNAVLQTNVTYLIVLEYVFNTDELDVVNIWIDPAKEQSEPLFTTPLNLYPAQTDATQICGVALRSNDSTPTDMLIDEIKVTTTWDELFLADDPGEPTGLNVTTLNGNTAIYNLQGMRLEQLQKGVNIVVKDGQTTKIVK